MSVKGIKMGEISEWKQNLSKRQREGLQMTDQNTVIGLQGAPLAKYRVAIQNVFYVE